MRLHVTLTDRGIAATFEGAMELLRGHHIGAARTAVVVAAAGAHRGARNRGDNRCLREREEFSWHNN